MADIEKGLHKIWGRLGEIRDLLTEIRDGLIAVDDGTEDDPAEDDQAEPEQPAGPRAVG